MKRDTSYPKISIVTPPYNQEEFLEREILREVGITEDYVMLWGSGEAYREFLYVESAELEMKQNLLSGHKYVILKRKQ